MSYYVAQPLFAAALVVLGVLGAALALRAFRDGRVRPGLRRTGWALIPFGLLAVGVSGLLARVVGAVSRWAFQLVFSPVSWAGVVILGLGALLVLVGRDRSSGASEKVASRRADRSVAPRTRGRSAAVEQSRQPGQPTPPTSRSTRDAGASGLLAELDEMGLLDDDERR